MRLIVNHLRKSFIHGKWPWTRAPQPVLSDVTLTLRPGEIALLTGPNGSGKTTLLKTIGTLLIPDDGTLEINGVDVLRHPDRAKPHLGLSLGKERGFYHRLTARQNLSLSASLADLTWAQAQAVIDEWSSGLAFQGSLDLPVSSYSAGTLHKLDLIRSALHRPSLFLLDEPFNHLDPVSQDSLSDFLRRQAETGTAFLITGHLTPPSLLPTRTYRLAQGRLDSTPTPIHG